MNREEGATTRFSLWKVKKYGENFPECCETLWWCGRIDAPPLLYLRLGEPQHIMVGVSALSSPVVGSLIIKDVGKKCPGPRGKRMECVQSRCEVQSPPLYDGELWWKCCGEWDVFIYFFFFWFVGLTVNFKRNETSYFSSVWVSPMKGVIRWSNHVSFTTTFFLVFTLAPRNFGQ